MTETKAEANERFVKSFQNLHGLTVDGWAGKKTFDALGVVESRFDACLAETLRHEGGWSDHPADKGGATMKGITLITYRAYRPGATKQDLKNISQADVEMIYRAGYWDKCRCDDLPAGVDLMVFDIAVNSGPRRAAEWVQEAVGATVDGVIGDRTIAKVNAAQPLAIIDTLDKRRDRFYRSLGTWTTFGKGWTNRRLSVTAKAKEMAK